LAEACEACLRADETGDLGIRTYKDCCGPRVTHTLPGVSGALALTLLAPTLLKDGSAATRGAKAVNALENFMVGTRA
jgi:uncharacterized membrane protein